MSTEFSFTYKPSETLKAVFAHFIKAKLAADDVLDLRIKMK